MSKLVLIAATTVLLLSGNHAHAEGNVAAGQQKSQVCQACHSADGSASADNQAQYPRLAGQYADYLVKALKDYKSGARQNAIMAGFVANLSEQDMQDLAAYFAAQKPALRDLSHLK